MPIDFTKSAISAGVGVVDELLDRMDAKSTPPRTGQFRTFQDMGRIAIAGAGYALQAFMPKYASLGETLALSGTPLLAKTIFGPLVSRAMRVVCLSEHHLWPSAATELRPGKNHPPLSAWPSDRRR